MFAALATGNPVIIKPHSNAILPAAITVKIAREVLAEAGLDPNLVSLAVVEKRADTQALATHPAVKSIDFTGSNVFGKWLLDNARQANVYAELAGEQRGDRVHRPVQGNASQPRLYAEPVLRSDVAPPPRPS